MYHLLCWRSKQEEEFFLGEILSVVHAKAWVIRSCVRHYWQNGGTAPNPLSFSRRHRPWMKELALVILTCSSSRRLSWLERMLRCLFFLREAWESTKPSAVCAQKIIYKVTLTVLQGFLQRVSQDEYIGCSLRPWEGLLSETCLWGRCLWQRKCAEFRV